MHDFVTKNAFRIDHEETSQCDTTILNKDAVITSNLLGRVRRQRILQTFDSALVTRRINPRAVRVNRVSRNTDHVRADVFEILITIAESGQFRGTNKSE